MTTENAAEAALFCALSIATFFLVLLLRKKKPGQSEKQIWEKAEWIVMLAFSAALILLTVMYS